MAKKSGRQGRGRGEQERKDGRLILFEDRDSEAAELERELGDFAAEVHRVRTTGELWAKITAVGPHGVVAHLNEADLMSGRGAIALRSVLLEHPYVEPWLYTASRMHNPGCAAAEMAGLLSNVSEYEDIVEDVRRELPFVVRACEARRALVQGRKPVHTRRTYQTPPGGTRLRKVTQAVEKACIESALARSGGLIRPAAEDLGMDKSHLKRLIDAYGIDVSAFKRLGKVEQVVSSSEG